MPQPKFVESILYYLDIATPLSSIFIGCAISAPDESSPESKAESLHSGVGSTFPINQLCIFSLFVSSYQQYDLYY
jgi:hypothetical protein